MFMLVVERITGLPLFMLSALSPHLGIPSLWQVFTHVLVYPPAPGSVLSLAISLFFFWLIAAPFEMRFGPKRTLQLCALAALSSGVAALLAGQVLPSTVMYGTGPVLLAIIAAYAISLPPEVELSFFGVLPLKPRALIGVVLGLSAVMALAGENYAGLVGDLAAVGTAIVFMRWMLRPPSRRKRSAQKKASSNPPLRIVYSGDKNNPPKWLN